MKPAFVLSGHTMALGVVRALGMMGVPVVVFYYDDHSMAQVSKYVKDSVKIPHPEQAERRCIEMLIRHSEKFGEGILFPVSDEAVAAVSRNKRLLEPFYTVACPEWEITRRFLDKRNTYVLAKQHAIPAPRTFFPCSEQDLTRFIGGIEFPYLVKPCQSHLFHQRFGKKMFPVATPQQMLEAYRLARSSGLEVMLQEYIPGDDTQVVNYNAYAWEGRSLVEFTAAHVRNAPPFFGSPRVAVSRDIPEVLKPGRNILKALGFYGYACTEFKKDCRDGIFKLMEVNGRHNLSTLLAVRCGINFPWLHYRHLMHGELPEAAAFEKEIYWIDLVRDVGYSLRYLATEKYSPTQYLRPYAKPHVFAILDRGDFRPFIRRISALVRKISQSLRPGREKQRNREPQITLGK
ncbi:MAG: hypothetical protein JXB25_00655 [Deltaproteobacteria bacterium]|nr:hypothetical protein [Deltaproteobacteria bacterium]